MASALDAVVIDPFESVLDSMGLMEGQLAPAKRTLLGASLGAGLVFLVKPSIAFDGEGMLRPWSMTSDAPNATSVPWWMFAAGPAFILGVLI